MSSLARVYACEGCCPRNRLSGKCLHVLLPGQTDRQPTLTATHRVCCVKCACSSCSSSSPSPSGSALLPTDPCCWPLLLCPTGGCPSAAPLASCVPDGGVVLLLLLLLEAGAGTPASGLTSGCPTLQMVTLRATCCCCCCCCTGCSCRRYPASCCCWLFEQQPWAAAASPLKALS